MSARRHVWVFTEVHFGTFQNPKPFRSLTVFFRHVWFSRCSAAAGGGLLVSWSRRWHQSDPWPAVSYGSSSVGKHLQLSSTLWQDFQLPSAPSPPPPPPLTRFLFWCLFFFFLSRQNHLFPMISGKRTERQQVEAKGKQLGSALKSELLVFFF